MAKIKLNLPTGVSVEKILLNCFKADNNSYVIFDAESVGSMGLPIILVCKFENNRVVKIENAEEWTKVKGYLKEIISGGSKEYFMIESEVFADELFYTQLTLPVASFDALRNAYKYDEGINATPINNTENAISLDTISLEPENMENGASDDIQPATPKEEISNVMPVIDNVVAEITPANNENNLNSSVSESNIISNEAVANPLINENTLPNLEIQSDLVAPEVTQEKSAIVNASLTEQPLPLNDEVTTDMTSQIEVAQDSKFDYAVDKEAFLKACENMFDALVAKFQNK